MAEKGKPKNRKRKYFEIEKSRQSPFQNSDSQNASATVVSKAPRGINVAEFAESRALEIQNMMHALANASAVSNKRVFQSIPRHMRRRAASHNSKRMPVRLREAYKREAAKSQEKMKETKKKKSRRHRRRPSNLLDEYTRRQRKHVWLETHIWHAKRFKMSEQWGYKIPLHPNDKSVRASYRAMATGCLMQDLSYYQCIEVSGKQERIIAAMKHLTNSDAGLTMAAKQYLNGSREGHVVLYKYDKYPWCAVGPVSFLWQQHLCSSFENGTLPGSDKAINMADDTVTKLWVWSHPACSDEVFSEIVHACSLEGRIVLTDIKSKKDEKTETEIPEVLLEGKNPSKEPRDVLVTVLKEQLVKFRLIGPKSHALLASALELCEWGITKDDERHRWWQTFTSNPDNRKNLTDQNALWNQMKSVTSPGVLVSGSVMALVVKDPRLGLPMKKSSIDMASEDLHKEGQISEDLTFTSCTAGSAFSPLWDFSTRQEVKQTKLPEKELNERRSKMMVPGSKLDLGEDSSRIPILVIQQPGTRGHSGSINFGCGYDVVIPAGWSMAFWISLVYRGARVGGTRESTTCSREQALPHFPCDYPDTDAGQMYNEEQSRTAGEKYTKYPPAKRPNYEKLGVYSPFSRDWGQLLKEWSEEVGRIEMEMEKYFCSGNAKDEEMPVVNRHVDRSTETDEIRTGIDEKILPAGKTSQTPSCSSQEVFYVIRSYSTRRRLQQICQSLQTASSSKTKKFSSSKNKDFGTHIAFLRENLNSFYRSLICVELLMLHKGSPLVNAVIFIPKPEDLRALEKDKNYGGPCEPVHKGKKGENSTGSKSGTLIGRCTRTAIGYVSSGQYSFARGQGAAVGFCALPGFCELTLMASREKCKPLVLVRNTTSFQYRFASFIVV